MTLKDILALQYNVHVEYDDRRQRTQCPRCSAARKFKVREKCLVVDFSGWEANWFCFHCGRRGSTHEAGGKSA